MEKINTYYCLLLDSPNFLLTEPLEEIFRERACFARKCNTHMDTWIVKNPSFLAIAKERFNLSNISLNQDNFVLITCDPDLALIFRVRLRGKSTHFQFATPCSQIKSPLSSVK